MSVRAASSNNTAEPKYDMLVSSMPYIAHNGVVTMMMFYRRRASPKLRNDIIEV